MGKKQNKCLGNGAGSEQEKREVKETRSRKVKNAYPEKLNKIEETIHATDGCYNAILTVCQDSIYPIQKQLGLTRYRIPNPPRYMRNAPQHIVPKQ